MFNGGMPVSSFLLLAIDLVTLLRCSLVIPPVGSFISFASDVKRSIGMYEANSDHAGHRFILWMSTLFDGGTGVSRFSGMGMVEWNTGMVDYWNTGTWNDD